MTIAQNSLLVRFFIAVWTTLRDAWYASAPGRLAAWMGGGIRATVAGSGLCQFLWRDGAVTRSWPGSLSCTFFTAVLNLPCALFKWLYKIGKGVWDSSFVLRFFSALGGSSFVFLGLFLLVMLIAPHAVWNNAYAFLGAATVFALFSFGSGKYVKHRIELERLGPYYLLFLGFIVYGFLGSLSPSLSLRFFLFHMAAFLIVALTVSAVQKKEQLQLILVLVAAGLTVASLYGCYQGYLGVEVVASQQDMTVNVGMPGRIYSFFDNPNNFAEILAMFIPFMLALFLNAKTWRGKLLAVFALVPCLSAIGLTLSRSSWIGLVIAVVVFLLLQNWRFLPLFVVLGLCALPLLPESIMNRILTIGNMNDTSTRYRFAIYGATENLMRDYGLRGVGLGNDVMTQVFQVYPTMFDGNYPIHTHNNYLQMWGELGLLGGLSYIAVILAQLKAGVKAFYSSADRAVKNILSAAIGSFCGILVIGVAEYTWFYARNMFFWWFLFGVIAACIKLLRVRKEK